MSFDAVDWYAYQEKQKKERVSRQQTHLRQVAQAEVPMTALTGSREWDLYLQVVQAMIANAERDAAAVAAAMEDPLLLDREEMLCQKVQLVKVRQAVETMKELRDLPKVLVERGREAKRLLKKYGIEG